MDEKNGLLTLAAYMAAATLIVLTAFWGVFEYGTQSNRGRLPTVQEEPVAALATTRLEKPVVQNVPQASATGMVDQQRIRLLETMLQQKTERLQEKTALLERRTADYEELLARFQRSLEQNATAGDGTQDGHAPVGHTEERKAESADSEGPVESPPAKTDVTKLEAEMSMAEAVQQSLVSDLETMQNELAAAYEELAGLHDEMDRTSIRHLEEQLALESASTEVLVKIGAPAVAMLRNGLNNDKPIVRRWAANALGQIGAEAYEAVPDLTEALSDSDEQVRRAAKSALDAIGG